MTDIDAIVAGLSEAQRAYLTAKAEWRSPALGCDKRWMTFPPKNTHQVLMQHGLVDAVGQIRDLGVAVRAAILRGQ